MARYDSRHRTRIQMTPKKMTTVLLTLVIFVCAILLIYYGLTVANPYSVTSEFITSQCRPLAVTDHGKTECSCNILTSSGAGLCVSYYPCAEITVSYPMGGTCKDGVYRSKLLETLIPDYRNVRCVIRPCDESWHNNNRTVYDVLQTYGNTASNLTYTCYYSPDHPDLVILERTKLSHVVVVMILPSLGILVSGVIITVLNSVGGNQIQEEPQTG